MSNHLDTCMNEALLEAQRANAEGEASPLVRGYSLIISITGEYQYNRRLVFVLLGAAYSTRGGYSWHTSCNA